MSVWLVQIDEGKPYRQSCNIFSEILDDAEPKHTRSTLSAKREMGLTTGSGGKWEMEYSAPRRYVWDEFESEWAMR